MPIVGVDLSASSKKPSTYAVMDKQGRLQHLATFKEGDELIRAVAEHDPWVIAIDAPLGIPMGLCCLEASCQCTITNSHKGRVAEQQLASRRIGCFFTTKQSIIRKLIYRAIELRRNLAGLGYQVIEVYPYATKLFLFGTESPAKSSPDSMPFLKGKLPAHINGVEPYIDDLNHDRCDAILSAYTGYLHQTGRTEQLGDQQEGFIVIPQG